RFVAYGAKPGDLTAYGLAKPEATITVTVKAPAGDPKTSKPVEHSLALGSRVGAGDRYARLDNGPGIVVLGEAVAGELTHGYLDFVNRMALKLDAGKITAIERQQGKEILELVKRNNGWFLLQPVEMRADGPSMEALTQELASLR